VKFLKIKETQRVKVEKDMWENKTRASNETIKKIWVILATIKPWQIDINVHCCYTNHGYLTVGKD
jgi:hypothetical protein